MVEEDVGQRPRELRINIMLADVDLRWTSYERVASAVRTFAKKKKLHNDALGRVNYNNCQAQFDLAKANPVPALVQVGSLRHHLQIPKRVCVRRVCTS